MRPPVQTALSDATPEQLKIGRGEVSGPGGKWRVHKIADWVEAMTVYYSDATYRVRSPEEWLRLPDHGLQVVASLGGVWKGADEYRYHEASKFGLYLDDSEYEPIEVRARG